MLETKVLDPVGRLAIAIALAGACQLGCRDVAGLSGLTIADGGAGAGAGAAGSGASGGGGAGGTGGAAGGAAGCLVFEPSPTGNILIASPSTDPTHPVLFTATFEEGNIVLLARSAADQMTHIGDEQSFPVTLTEEGFFFAADGLFIPGGANPGTGNDSTVNVELEDQFCDPYSVCGTMSGEITSPTPISLTGSTFFLQGSLDPQFQYPIDCNGNLSDF